MTITFEDQVRAVIPPGNGAGTATDRIVMCSTVEVLRRTKHAGEPITTGIAQLDRQLRGGIRPRRTLMAASPAGHGKTALAGQIADAAAAAGAAVFCLMVDEGDEPACVRVGQRLGYIREQVEDRADELLAQMDRDLSTRLLRFSDPGTVIDPTIESAAEAVVELMQTRSGSPGLLVLDSIQRVQSRESAQARSERERVTLNGQTARRMAVQHGIAVVFTSETNRGFYRAKREQDRGSDLAAAAEARLEFWVDVCLTMRAREDDPYLVDVHVPKNRLGSRVPMVLRLDPARAMFEAVDEDPRGVARDAAKDALVEKQTQGVLLALQRQPGLTQTQLGQVVGGKRQAFLEALAEIKAKGVVTWKPDGRSIRHYLSEIPKG